MRDIRTQRKGNLSAPKKKRKGNLNIVIQITIHMLITQHIKLYKISHLRDVLYSPSLNIMV